MSGLPDDVVLERLEALLEHVEALPVVSQYSAERAGEDVYCQADWLGYTYLDRPDGRKLCGTRACLAGWTLVLHGTESDIEECAAEQRSWVERSRQLLGISERHVEADLWRSVCLADTEDAALLRLRHLIARYEEVGP